MLITYEILPFKYIKYLRHAKYIKVEVFLMKKMKTTL